MDVIAAPFRLILAALPPRALTVRQIRGREQLSGPYRFDVICTLREPPPLADLLQSPAALILRTVSPPRVISGTIAAVWHEGIRRDEGASEQVSTTAANLPR